MKHKVLITMDGDIVFIYSDALAGLERAGQPCIRRVSNVEFDHTKKEWIATSARDGILLAHDKSRNAVISQEIELLSNQLPRLATEIPVLQISTKVSYV